jgi:hypothetical protein
MLTLEHIDPLNGLHKLVCGLRNEFNEILAEDKYNYRKTDRFVPYRVCDCLAPVTFGDEGEFLINGEWLICEFGGPEWWAESNRLGNSQVQKPFSGRTHTNVWKRNNSEFHIENWKTRDKSQIQLLGKGDHKRNNAPGRAAAAITGHPHKRKHWPENLYLEVQEKYLNRTSFHWGRKELCEKYGVTVRTIENMVKHIRRGKTLTELTS